MPVSSKSPTRCWRRAWCKPLPTPVWERACSRLDRREATDTPRRLHREQARSHMGGLSILQAPDAPSVPVR
ncbi:hypothetical protein CJU78_04655 [Pseudomonas fragi]|nr:hypothetical protein CJU78_04655 [Pseudomonas fragi]